MKMLLETKCLCEDSISMMPATIAWAYRAVEVKEDKRYISKALTPWAFKTSFRLGKWFQSRLGVLRRG